MSPCGQRNVDCALNEPNPSGKVGAPRVGSHVEHGECSDVEHHCLFGKRRVISSEKDVSGREDEKA